MNRRNRYSSYSLKGLYLFVKKGGCMALVKDLSLKSIGVKLFLIVFSAIVLLSAIVGIFSYQMAKGIITDEVSTASKQAMVQAADKLDFLFSEYEASSRQLAVDTVLKSDLELVTRPNVGTKAKSEAETRIKAKLDALKASDERLLGVRLLSLDLVDVHSYRSSGIINVRTDEEVLSQVEMIKGANGKVVWLPTKLAGFFNNYTEPTLTMGRLLRNMEHPEAEYILLFEIKEQSLATILTNLEIGQHGQVTIVTEEDRIVYAADPALLETTSPIAIQSQNQVASQAEGQEQSQTEGGTFTISDGQGVPQLVVHQPLKTTGWSVVGYAPMSDFLEPAKKLLVVTLAVVLIAVVLALLIGYYIVRTVGKPLAKLCLLMEEGERGNLKVRTGFKGKDEIARLGSSFNRMMQQISMLVEQSHRSAKEVLTTAEELAQASNNTSTAAGEIASASQEIAQGAASLATEAETENLLADQIAERIHQVVDRNRSMEAAADDCLNVSEQGAEHMKQLVEKTTRIAERNQKMRQQAAVLHQSTRSIHQILELMSTITQQTNILSLNATIEAARAGTAGRGFMVVADEIRRLAEQSKESIQTVAEITTEISQGIEGTVASLNEVTPMYDAQIQDVQEASKVFQNVKQQMDQFLLELQQSGVLVDQLMENQQQLSSSIASASAVVEETSAATEEVASMSSEQYVVSEKLVALSAQLKKLSESLQESLVIFDT